MPANFIIVHPAGAPGAINLPELLAALRVVVGRDYLDIEAENAEAYGEPERLASVNAVRRALGYPVHPAKET